MCGAIVKEKRKRRTTIIIRRKKLRTVTLTDVFQVHILRSQQALQVEVKLQKPAQANLIGDEKNHALSFGPKF